MSGKVRITKFCLAEHAGLLPEGWPEGVDLALRSEGDEHRLVGVHRDEEPEEYRRRIAHTERRPHRHYLLTPAEDAEKLFPVLVESMADTPDLLDLGLEFEMNYDFILSEGLDEAYMKDEASLVPQGEDGKFVPILSAERLVGVEDGRVEFLPDGAGELAFPGGLGSVEIGASHVSQSMDGTITRIDMSGLEDRDMVPSLMRLPAGSFAMQSGRTRLLSRGKYLFIFLDPFGGFPDPQVDDAQPGAVPPAEKRKRKFTLATFLVCVIAGAVAASAIGLAIRF